MTWPLGVTSSRSSGANTGRRASTVVHDGLRTGPVDSKGVAAWAQALAGAVRADVGDPDGNAAPRNDRDLPHVAGMVDMVTSQLPIRGGQLITAVDRWSRTGQLYASARDLPPMNACPRTG